MTIKKASTTKEKKVSVKRVAKTTEKKSTVKPKLQLVHASGEYCFWTHDGSIISNLSELQDVLGSMTNDVFAHHVTKDRNDFADWIEGVLEDSVLAKSIRTAKKPESAHAQIVKRLKLYNI